MNCFLYLEAKEKKGWLKNHVDFIVQDLGARQVISVSEKVANIYNDF